MIEKIKGNFNRKVWAFMAVAILADWLLAFVGTTTGLPIVSFVGLLLISAVCGPWAGALTGLLGNLITSSFWFLFYQDSRSYIAGSLLGWCVVYLFVGYFAGRMSQWGYFKFWWTSILAGFITAISTLTVFLVFRILGADLSTVFSDFSMVFSATYFVIPMTISALIVFFLVKSSFNKFFVGLPHTDYVQSEPEMNISQINGDELSLQKSGPTTSQKAIGVTVLAIAIFSITFVIWIAMEISASTR